MICEKCGNENTDGIEFCVHCKGALNQPAPAPPDSLSDVQTKAGPESSESDDERSIDDVPPV